MNKKVTAENVLLLAVSLMLVNSHLLADELGREPEKSTLFPQAMEMSGSVAITTQVSNQKKTQNEVLTSFDLLGGMQAKGGQFNFYIEGNTSPEAQGVSQQIQGSNADAGTALNNKGEGRIQLSEFNYSGSLYQSQFAIGLIDPAAFLDTSIVANDERTQFLSKQLVNNTSIALPDYTLAVAYHHEPKSSVPGYTLFVSSSHGLADTENNSYKALLDVSAKRKGIFTAVEMYHSHAGLTPRLGVWYKNAELVNNYGAYITIDNQVREFRWNARLGWAAPTVAQVNHSASMAVELPVLNNITGFGMSYLRTLADAFFNNSEALQAELYVRLRLNKQIHLTPSIQYFSNSEINGNYSGNDSLVGNLRFGYEV